MKKSAVKKCLAGLLMLAVMAALAPSGRAGAADLKMWSKVKGIDTDSFDVSVKSQYAEGESIKISWSGAEGADTYELIVCNDNGDEVFCQDVTGAGWDIGKLPGGDYSVSVTPYYASESGTTVNCDFTVGTGAYNPGTETDPEDGSEEPDSSEKPAKASFKVTSITYNEEGYFPNDSLKFSWNVSGSPDSYKAVLKSDSGETTEKTTESKSINFGKQPVGDYTLTVTPYSSSGAAGGKRSVSFTVFEEDGIGDYDDGDGTFEKEPNPLTLKVKSRTYMRNKDLRKSRSFVIGASKGRGAVDYSLSASAQKAKIKVSSNGKVKIPKNCKRGKYIITVTAEGDEEYDPIAKTVKIVVK